MADVIGGGGMVGQFPLEQWFYEMPVCTRCWMTAALSVSVLVQCHILNPFQLFYSVRTVFYRSQVCLSTMLSLHLQLILTTSTVLAACHDILLLWTTQSRPPVPHLLPPAIFAPPRRVVGTIARPLFMAPRVLFNTAPLYSPDVFDGIPRECVVEHAHLHMESEEPRHLT